MKRLSGWGNFPHVAAHLQIPTKNQSLQPSCQMIPRGLGRSYGDSALASNVVSSRSMNRFISFDETSGVLRCDAGVSLAEILEVFVPKGWFLPVTPGTKFVTVGGAIASDVHGKNHHKDGCFSEFVLAIRLNTIADIIDCSPAENSEIFSATCGGMGLTGFIVEATIQLKPIESAYISQRTIKTQSLEETVEIFEQNKASTYSVAWIDCLATGAQLGRSLVMLGEHMQAGGLQAHKDSTLTLPVHLPAITLNPLSIKAFNVAYYNRVRERETDARVHYNPYFYPLDGINHWNRMYGRQGFTQYQFVLPTSAGLESLGTILETIVQFKNASFLAVLKAFGAQNENFLSFPVEGLTLALDFKINPSVFDLLDKLDALVLKAGGRVYLTKDARMTESTFKQSYPRWKAFSALRKSLGVDRYFNSMQSQRLGI